MKKLISFLLVCVVTVALAVPAFAAGNSAVLSELNSGVKVSGKTLHIPAQYVNAAEKFLDTKNLTKEQSDKIVSYIKDAKSAVLHGCASTGNASITSLSSSAKKEILRDGQAAAAVVGLKLSVNNDRSSVTITDNHGNVVFEGNSVIKTTGGAVNWNYACSIAVALIAVLGTAGAAAVRYRVKSARI